jgi:thiol-disulfide isomerase/thioredoxin
MIIIKSQQLPLSLRGDSAGGDLMRFLLAMLLGLTVLGVPARPAGAGSPVTAPDFIGGGPWFNTNGQALTVAGLRGKVVAVEMWTGGCINCINTLPYVKQWDARYRAKGLVTIGVHTPEFGQEHSQEFVQQAIAREGIKYPVVMDNNFKIWDAYHNVYWPTLYLIDKKGYIRYTHIGEGDYDVTDGMIAKLLSE